MTAIDDLLAEDIPHRPDPAPPRPRTYQPTWTPEEQDQHWADLCNAIGVRNERQPRTAA